MLRAEIIVPDFEFELANPVEVLRALASYQLRATRDRILAGEAADGGSLPQPKDGGKALLRSRQLFDSLRAQIHTEDGSPWAEVLPTGERTEAKAKASRRRKRLSGARKAVKSELEALGLSEQEIKSRVRRVGRGSRFRSGKNMDIAAILAYAPKDRRSANGQRGRYNVFHTTAEERRDLASIAAALAVASVRERDGGARYTGQGEAT